MAVLHLDVILSHIRKLGQRLNAKKSVLLPAQRTTFLDVVWDSTMIQLFPAHIALMLSAINGVKIGQLLSVKQFQRLLGLLQWWLRTREFCLGGNPLHMIKVTRQCRSALVM